MHRMPNLLSNLHPTCGRRVQMYAHMSGPPRTTAHNWSALRSHPGPTVGHLRYLTLRTMGTLYTTPASEDLTPQRPYPSLLTADGASGGLCKPSYQSRKRKRLRDALSSPLTPLRTANLNPDVAVSCARRTSARLRFACECRPRHDAAQSFLRDLHSADLAAVALNSTESGMLRTIGRWDGFYLYICLVA